VVAIYIEIGGRTVQGVFLKRPNRFLAVVKIGNRAFPSSIPNPGRMLELLTPGIKVVLREVLKENRKTSHDLIGVFNDGQIVSTDSRVPNRLVLEALRNKDIEKLSSYNRITPEHGYRHTRFDFLLTDDLEACLLEVKSCTLVRDGVALFPDARTKRGARHIRELTRAKGEGYRACVLFLIQRTDARALSPNDETDPEFGRTLREAATGGVEVLAYCCEFAGEEIALKGKVTVDLGLTLRRYARASARQKFKTVVNEKTHRT